MHDCAAAPLSEAQRLSSLHALGVLDSEPEEIFDAIVQMAAGACGTPIALLTLIDVQRQWVKAQVGMPGITETARDASLCNHAVLSDRLLLVPDAAADLRFGDKPSVRGPPYVRFYAGAPLVLADGARVGALCVVDRSPRQLDPVQIDALQSLARIATQALEMRGALLREQARSADAVPRQAAARAQALAERGLCADAPVDDQLAYALLHRAGDSTGGRARAEEALRTSQQFLSQAGHVAGIGGWALDLGTERLTWSEQTRRIHEVDDAFVPTVDHAIDFYAPESRAAIREAIDAGMRAAHPWDLELRLVTAKGRAIWVRAVGEVVCEDGQPVRMLGAFQDVTERKGLEQLVARQGATLRAVVEAVPANVSVVDRHGVLQFANGNFERWCGAPRTEILGRPLADVLGRVEYERSLPWFERVAAGETVSFETECVGRRDSAPWAVTYIPLWNEPGRTDGFVQVAHAVRQHRIEAGRPMPASQRDPLTGLLNRAGLVAYMERQMAENGGATLAVLCIELAPPAPGLARHGPAVRDRLLQLFAQRLGGLVRPRDAVARLGRSTFAVVLAGIADALHAGAVADKVSAAAQDPFEIESLRVASAARVGVAWGLKPGQPWTSLLTRADALLHGALGR
ncbi:sensor domain-containing diguanylate cyclase [Pseudorhodoferax soli]|uniref:PAS domain S-box-containing protein/diguanylate cyclase (GGDEF)-like protein n=1 Tax=Pseudorhodoferax soli TaxID=545864 RepID=A0A368Y189_9BURK|nr:PAS domain-containing protein [Pseudorhodoferax soli]RCW72557.1 PAS domain S-box-containing protein/diguanylate cyclase (GGDEF)-like protein [Pseudorhodoferax soli]